MSEVDIRMEQFNALMVPALYLFPTGIIFDLKKRLLHSPGQH